MLSSLTRGCAASRMRQLPSETREKSAESNPRHGELRTGCTAAVHGSGAPSSRDRCQQGGGGGGGGGSSQGTEATELAGERRGKECAQRAREERKCQKSTYIKRRNVEVKALLGVVILRKPWLRVIGGPFRSEAACIMLFTVGWLASSASPTGPAFGADA
eukprot:3351237-Rhodomonas_salina.1